LWLRCGIDEWHLDCRAGGELDLTRSVATPKSHDYIAAVRRKEDVHRFEFFLTTSSDPRVFDSGAALNGYLRALGLEEIAGISSH
jgi:hypothetical protein